MNTTTWMISFKASTKYWPLFIIGFGTTATNLFFFRQIALFSSQPTILLALAYVIIFASLALGTWLPFTRALLCLVFIILPIWQWLGINFVSVLYYIYSLNLFQLFSFYHQGLSLGILLLPANLCWGALLQYFLISVEKDPKAYLIDTAGSFSAGMAFHILLQFFPQSFYHTLSLFLIPAILFRGYLSDLVHSRILSRKYYFFIGGYVILLIGLLSGQLIVQKQLQIENYQSPYHGLYRFSIHTDTLYYRDNHFLGTKDYDPQTFNWFDLAISLPDHINTALLIQPRNYHLLTHLNLFPGIRFFWQEQDRQLPDYWLHEFSRTIYRNTPCFIYSTAEHSLTQSQPLYDLILIEGELPISTTAIKFYTFLAQTRLPMKPDGLLVIKLPIPENYCTQAEIDFWSRLYGKFTNHYSMVQLIHSDFTFLIAGHNPGYELNLNRTIDHYRQRVILEAKSESASDLLFPYYLSARRDPRFQNLIRKDITEKVPQREYLLQKSALLGQNRHWWSRYFPLGLIAGITGIVAVFITLCSKKHSYRAYYYLTGVISLSYFLYNLQLYQSYHGLMIKNLGLLNMGFFGGLMLGYGISTRIKNGFMPLIILGLALIHLLIDSSGLGICLLRLIGWGIFQGCLYYGLAVKNKIKSTSIFIYDFLGTAMAAIITLGLFWTWLWIGIDLGRIGFPLIFLLLAITTFKALKPGINP